MQPDPAAAFGDKEGRVLGRARRHRERPGARCVGERRLFGEEMDIARNPDELFDLFVVGGDLGVVERPVGDVCSRDGTEQGELLEVDVPESRRLRVPVNRASADGLGQGLDRPGDRLCLRRRAEHPWFGARVRLGEGAAPLELVVREHGAGAVGA